MVKYTELSSLTNYLGISENAFVALVQSIPLHYHHVQIPKANGKVRVLSVPDRFLKSVQRKIIDNLLSQEEVSPYATAYLEGTSTVKNAFPHLRSNKLLKLDIKHFFDNISFLMLMQNVFVSSKYSTHLQLLLSSLCVYCDALPQGAPTSPIISNIIMKDFDNKVGLWCFSNNIRYTRYCDDMTFSGDFDHTKVIAFVKEELKKMGFMLNEEKTVVACRGQKQVVTGITVNERLNTPASYRKKIRQELYFCKKFGIFSHMRHLNITVTEPEYINRMLGKVNYVLSVDKNNSEMQEYKKWLLERKAYFDKHS